MSTGSLPLNCINISLAFSRSKSLGIPAILDGKGPIGFGLKGLTGSVGSLGNGFGSSSLPIA